MESGRSRLLDASKTVVLGKPLWLGPGTTAQVNNWVVQPPTLSGPHGRVGSRMMRGDYLNL